jgi:hypothetical protein
LTSKAVNYQLEAHVGCYFAQYKLTDQFQQVLHSRFLKLVRSLFLKLEKKRGGEEKFTALVLLSTGLRKLAILPCKIQPSPEVCLQPNFL